MSLQAIFTLSCAFVFAGVQDGMGRHNDAITDDGKKVSALMVCLALTLDRICSDSVS